MKNLKIHLYAVLVIGILSCSGSDMEDERGTDPDIENIELRNFISTLESWTSHPKTSVDWTHETDSEGNLVKSVMYEKYPRRVIWEIEYLEHKEDQLPIEYQKTYYSFGEPNNVLTWDVGYSNDGLIEGLTAYQNGSFSQEFTFSQLDDKMRVQSALFYNDVGEFQGREVYDYDENGNHKTISHYNTQSGNDQTALKEKWEYHFTDFGDRKSTTYENAEDGYIIDYTHSYRENFTRESTESVTQYSTNNPNAFGWREFDDEERIIYHRIIYGDSRWEYVAFFPNESVKILEYYQQDILMWVQTNAEDGSTELKIFNPEDGSYRIEYYDEEGTVHKVEYYDADGNLLNTESYSATRATQNLQKFNKPQFPENYHKIKNVSNTFVSGSDSLEYRAKL